MCRLKYIKLFEDWDYNDNKSINSLVKNARKWNLKDFIEEYVYLNDINYALKDGKIVNHINKGDEILLAREKRDDDGKLLYDENGLALYVPYKIVVSSEDYGNKIWKFIMDNTEELQKEAERLYNKYKNIKKPEFKKGSKTIKAYHASPYKFKKFKYQDKSVSGQLGSDLGFFFFLDKKNVDYYASVLKNNHGQAYVYEVKIQLGNKLELNGEDVGTNWGRHDELLQAEIEGYDTVIIRDADTGYGVTDEIIVYDDDNIKILDVTAI